MLLDGPTIVQLATERERIMQRDHDRWTKMAKIYSGKHRELFPREFPKTDVEKVAGFIKRSWRMFARMVGKVPDIQIAPLSLQDPDVQRADTLEKVCFAYNADWRMRQKIKNAAHYFVGFGAVGMGVFPDARRRMPKFLVEDPRNILPGPSWEATTLGKVTPNTQSIEALLAAPGEVLADCIVRKSMTGSQLAQAFGSTHPEVKKVIGDVPSGKTLTRPYTVAMYYDDEHVISVLEESGGVLATSEHKVGWCPWQMATVFSPGGEAAVSDLEQQIGIEITFSRMLNQKLALNDAVAYPWLVTRGTAQFDSEKRRIKLAGPDAQATFLTPPAEFQVDRDMALLRDLLRVLNFESEASQGSVQGGPITARGLVELGRATVDVVQEFFDDLSQYLATVYTTALKVDSAMFGGTKKSVSGQGRGEPFFTEYDPEELIGDHFGRVSIEFGPGLGGFEGHMQLLQDLGADAISVETVMEHNPHIRSISKEKRRIEISKLERFMMEQVLTGQSAVPGDWIAQAIQAIGGGKSFVDFVVESPPGQSTLTPESSAPVTPELAAAQAPMGLLPPGEEGAPEDMVFPPELSALLGGGP